MERTQSYDNHQALTKFTSRFSVFLLHISILIYFDIKQNPVQGKRYLFFINFKHIGFIILLKLNILIIFNIKLNQDLGTFLETWQLFLNIS
jgi:hypothetical protein